MARITRKHQKVFAASATNNGQFGSAQVGTKVTSSDPDTLQALAAFDAGWNSATISSQKLPTLEEMQALHFLTTRQIAYLFQEGIPEFSLDATYYQKSIVRKTGTYELYGSKTDNNTGNALPSQTDNTDWEYLGDLADISGGGPALTMDDIYPVGSTYENYIDSTNPAILLGVGTWVATGVGRTSIGHGGGYTAGTTGGSDTQTLSSANNGPHNHTQTVSPNSGGGQTGNFASTPNPGDPSLTSRDSTSSSGSGSPFSIVQSYEVYYKWKRTA